MDRRSDSRGSRSLSRVQGTMNLLGTDSEDSTSSSTNMGGDHSSAETLAEEYSNDVRGSGAQGEVSPYHEPMLKLGLNRSRRMRRVPSSVSDEIPAGPQLLDYSEPLAIDPNNGDARVPTPPTPPGDVRQDMENVAVHPVLSARSIHSGVGVVNQLGLETSSLMNLAKNHCCSTHGHTHTCSHQASHNISLESLDLGSKRQAHALCCVQSHCRYKSGITMTRGSCQCFH